MKTKLQLCFFLIFVLIAKINAQAPPEVLHYDFNGTGTSIPNLASSPPLGTTNASIVGTQSLGSTGQCGGALVGDGTTSSHVNTGWTPNLSGSWSISFWTASITPSSTLWYIFGDVNSGGFRCFTNGVAGANNWILRGTGLTDITITGGAVMSPQLNTFVYDATAGVTTAYLNGVFNASVTQAPFTLSGTGPFKVGQYGTNSGLPAGGLMDEFRFYSRALTPSEVQQLTNLVPTATNISVTSCGPYQSAGNNTYTVSGVFTETVNSCGGSATNTLNITINPLPTLTVTTSDTVICDGQGIDMIASGSSTSYSWSTGSTSFSTSVSPGTNTFYVVTGSLSSCSVNDTIQITVNPSPLVNVSASTPSICLGANVTFTATGAPVYSWSPAISSTDATVNASPSATTVYSVTGINSFSCTDTKTVEVIVNSFTPGITSPTEICAGDAITINATGGAGTSYTWSTGFIGFSSLPALSPAATTVYSVLSIGNNGCEGSNSTTITVNPVPLVTASAQRTLMCRGESNTLTATGADTYSWSTSATTSVTVISPNSNITFNYTVTGSNANGCSNTAEVSVKVDACTGISESGVFSSLKIYPNPTHGLFMIQNPVKENTISVSVYDVVGNLVYTSSAITDGMTIDIQQQAKGLYFVHLIQNEKTVEIRKLIKN